MDKRQYSNSTGTKKHDDKVIGQVFETTDFEMFKLSKFNRNILVRKELIEQARHNEIVAPIVVNENMVIIDGQHRWLAHTMAKTPIKYIVMPGLNDGDITRMNTLQKPWSLANWIEAYANEAREEYVKLFDLKKNLFASTTQLALVATDTRSASAAKQIIKSGDFKFKNYEKVVEFFVFVNSFFTEINAPVRSKVVEALWELFKLADIDLNRLTTKVIETKLDKEIRIKSFDKGESIVALLESYNSKLAVGSGRYIKYYIVNKNVVEIDAKKARWV